MYETNAELDAFFKGLHDQFRPVQVLGRGAFGLAIKVYDEEENLYKVFKLPRDRSVNEALRQEGALLRMLSEQSFPNVIRLYQRGWIKMEWEGVREKRYYLNMGYGGTSLREKLGKLRRVTDPAGGVSYRGSGNRIEIKQALQIAVDACNGLKSAHGFKGGPVRLIHRDVKPENILIDDETGVARLADFGISRIIVQTMDQVSFGGTPIYMDPECYHGRASIQSDLFSLGVVLYEMLTGELPFPTVFSRLDRPPMPPQRHLPELPGELDRIVMRMLEIRVLERYASAADLLDDLQRVHARLSSQPPHADGLGVADGHLFSRDIEHDGRITAGGKKTGRHKEDMSTIVPLGQDEQYTEARFDRLRAFLGAKHWQKADEETSRVMLTIAGRKTAGWLRKEDIEQLPWTALQRIDDLWSEASGGRFGLAVQRQIWSTIAADRARIEDKDLRTFGDRVGWRVNGEWLRKYSDVRFSLDAPAGHLPTLRFQAFEQTGNWWEDWRSSIKGFLLRGDE